MAAITQQMPVAVYGRRYGSFAGKEAAVVSGGVIMSMVHRRRRSRVVLIPWLIPIFWMML